MQIVRYIPSQSLIPILGFSWFVFPINHPSTLVSNQRLAKTSEVVALDRKSGIVVTKNTVYIPDGDLSGQNEEH